MYVFYSDQLKLDLPPKHRFPAEKYAMLREKLLSQEILSSADLNPAPLATRETIILAHSPAYFDSIYNGTAGAAMMRQIGLPWSQTLVQRSLASVGGTLRAAEEALSDSISGNLAGGTHHACTTEGQGFCVFNDLAITALYLLENQRVRRIAIIDLDVHQGNGSAEILSDRPEVFLFSMHGEKNYPFRKIPSTLDVGLPDGAGDQEYLLALESALPTVFAFQPDLILYQAGVDPLAEDRLGRLSLTHAGLAERDRMVLSQCKRQNIPVVLTLGGGYAKPIDLTVQAHAQTYRVALELFS
jgi:acetoin utilization deacetylase AcuC-like enzyme